MHDSRNRWLTALLAIAIATPVASAARADVQVNLTAQRVVHDTQGHDVLVAGDQARPGELLEYRAVYRNTGSRNVQKLMATLPIPQGMEYVPSTAAPALVLASTDGRKFEPVPLQRKVRLTDGREVMRDVPAGEYRWLRWPIGTLPGRGERLVQARVRVSSLVAVSNSRH